MFGARAAEDAGATASSSAALSPVAPHGEPAPLSLHALATLRHTMTMNVGLERSASGLRDALAAIARLERAGGNDADLKNMTATATLIAGAALKREESRGGHFRSDFPKPSDAWRHRTILRLDDAHAAAPNAQPTGTRAAL